jgi:hypothetical protein
MDGKGACANPLVILLGVAVIVVVPAGEQPAPHQTVVLLRQGSRGECRHQKQPVDAVTPGCAPVGRDHTGA